MLEHNLTRDARGPLVICTFTAADGRKYIGAARVFSDGEEKARQRAEAQARGKAERGAAE